MLDEINTKPKRILKMPGVTSLEINAPKIVPGIAKSPNFRPIEYSILFCLEYDIVDATALLNAAKRLLLAAKVGGKPKKVNTGTMMIPPPKPITEPNNPATKPSGTNHNSSSIVNVNTE